jgi:guanosine-3',5'-bis(diphosphate) 3'-pyrophosphohydrolase
MNLPDCILLGRAVALAALHHFSQRTDDGKPYIFHPLKVADLLEHDPEMRSVYDCDNLDRLATLQTIAVLHDILEDTKCTLQELEAYFPPYITQSVNALTKRPDQTYSNYLKQIMAHKDAVIVKLADLKHNSDPTRKKFDDITNPEKYQKRMEKYNLATRKLKAFLNSNGKSLTEVKHYGN